MDVDCAVQIVCYLQSPAAAGHLVLSDPSHFLLKPSFYQLYRRRANLLARAAGFPALPISVQLGSGKMCPDSSWGNSLKTTLSGHEWMNEWIPERHQGTCWAGRKTSWKLSSCHTAFLMLSSIKSDLGICQDFRLNVSPLAWTFHTLNASLAHLAGVQEQLTLRHSWGGWPLL